MSFLKLQTGDYLLLQTGDKLLLAGGVAPEPVVEDSRGGVSMREILARRARLVQQIETSLISWLTVTRGR